ncbi:MAG: cobalt-precorrin-5B (C(1))-methyltransferase CbiD [Spirochaetes bacterium]|nr:cobalt-precorrin-5B (C(1))-methyltransferase CbiD [Spirochaetota bacterium]
MNEYYQTINGKKLKLGFTTGTAAALAAKAAARMLKNQQIITEIALITPAGMEMNTRVFDQKFTAQYAECSVVKDAGDDPDVTNGLKVHCKVSYQKTNQIEIIGGHGIGKVTKKGLSVAVGEKAINPQPKKMIKEAVASILDDKGLCVKIWVPQGKEIAKKTFNQKLGIVDGISILGTTGIVKPMSQAAIIETIILELKVLREQSATVILTFGNYGKDFVIHSLNLPEKNIISMSNYCGEILKQVIQLDFQSAILVGHIGKIVKLAGSIFNTHSSIADARLEILASHFGYFSGDMERMKKIFTSNTTEEAIEYIEDSQFFHYFAQVIHNKIFDFLKIKHWNLKVMIFSQSRGLLGETS